jgi:hypothetical protein
MIVFELACDCGYTFEGWFQDRRDFDKQLSASILVCPDCGSRRIKKILSPNRTRSSQPAKDASLYSKDDNDALMTEAVNSLKNMQKFINENFEDVGAELATETLKIHYGVSEPRNLRGVTTPQEDEKLKEEGIELIKIPIPVKDRDTN